MATESTFVYDESFQTGASLASNQFYIVASTGANLVNLCVSSTAGAAGPLGILQNAPSSNQAANVRLIGKSKLVAGGAISVGAFVTATTGGTGLAASTSGQRCIGIANTASTGAGQVIEVVMLGPLQYFA